MTKNLNVAAKSKAATTKKDAIVSKAKPIKDQPAPAVEVSTEQRAADKQANDAMKFSIQQMQTPAVLETPAVLLNADAEKQAEFNAAVTKLAAEYGLSLPAPVVVKVKADKLQRNGITRPGANTVCGKIWAAADAISASQGGAPATIASLKAHSATQGINDHTIKTQYSRWRHYNGVAGRLPTIAVNQQPSAWNAAIAKVEDQVI